MNGDGTDIAHPGILKDAGNDMGQGGLMISRRMTYENQGRGQQLDHVSKLQARSGVQPADGLAFF